MRITRTTGSCSDGTCPAIYDTDDPEVIAIQGATVTDPEALSDIGAVPGHEGVVLIPRRLLASYQETP